MASRLSFSTMAQARAFSLLVDSGLRGHVNKTSFRANPSMRSAQILSCSSVTVFKETLNKVRPESDVVILSCVTSFLASADGPDQVSQRVDPVLQDVRDVLDEFCASRCEVRVLISPPMYRVSPVWFREGLPEILTSFSHIMNQDRPPNLHLLSSFPTPSYQPDGINLTPYSGLQFLMNLFDLSQELIEGLERPPDIAAAKTSEGTRVLEDRVMALEQDHKRLNTVVENKIAIDSELADFRENSGFLDHFVIAGLPLLPPDLTGKPWQDKAVSDVQDVIKLLMGRPMDIIFVANSTKRHKNAEVTYTVKMRQVADSQAIRDKFGSFFLGGSNKKPDSLKKYSIRNRITPETKVRIAVLQVLGRRYKTSNPGSKVKVIGYEPRPRIKITPASDATDRRVMNFTFVEAVKRLPTVFSNDDLDFIFSKVNLGLTGRLRSLFICLSDDEFRQRKPPPKPPGSNQATAESESGSGSDGDEQPEVTPVVPRAPPPSSSSGQSKSKHSSKESKGRSQKRGAESSPGASTPAKK